MGMEIVWKCVEKCATVWTLFGSVWKCVDSA